MLMNGTRKPIKIMVAMRASEYIFVTTTWLYNASKWTGLQSIGMVKSTVTENNTTTVMTRYYISSLEGTCKEFAYAVHSHWGIENSLHWCLDIAFREDESRIRNANAPDNFAGFAEILHICLNLLKLEKTHKAGLKGKRLKAGWNDNYREKVVFNL